jgi:diadenosine tetraphosphate (Ap4A) HIT family hydrolase
MSVADIPAGLLAMAQEINTRANGYNLALRSGAGHTHWKLEARRGGGWSGAELELLSEVAQKHSCELEEIDTNGTAHFLAGKS